MSDLVAQKRIDFTKLRNCGRIFTFPEKALVRIPRDRAYVRKGRGTLPLAVSRPPHIVLDAGRRFAIYSDQFLAVPARQIGIAGEMRSAELLQALAVYLSSDFVTYQQFLTCPEWGVDSNRATLDALNDLPTPLGELDCGALDEWVTLRDRLVAADASVAIDLLPSSSRHAERGELLRELNARVYELLGLRRAERVLVEDLVNIRMRLVKGKITKDSVRRPSRDEKVRYLRTLAHELDSFVMEERGLWHGVTAVCSRTFSMVCVELGEGPRGKREPTVLDADCEMAQEFSQVAERLRRRHSQWAYFDRSLRVYEGTRTYLFKPMERLHWTRTQALLDAGEVIAETLALGEG